ncbi:hypothetical protein NLI96_g5629 [Meripilus lineatus]|uniref:cAMP-independent regulatory protein n=1 Tax=Meripilus lineatus TaxID=2056292 RepID=A0AAD5V4R5_9APHY|nr:hypothetical protein NLI96_g5629 [Physisporinus lineatus]
MQCQSSTTHPALHLRDARDAHIVFEAVRLNILPLVTRRLTTTEREQLASGNVFVWEEAEHKQGGLERWTDGRRWSQSRDARGLPLLWRKRLKRHPKKKEAKAARRSEPPRKWHIVAYFAGDDYTCLPVVDNYEYLRSIRIPEGVYSSARGNLNKIQRSMPGADEPDHRRSHSGDHPSWVQPSWPSSATPCNPDQGAESPVSPSSSDCSSLIGGGPQFATNRRYDASTEPSLPRLSSIAPLHLPHPHRNGLSPAGPSNGYSPLTSEDRKALNSFRVVL